MSKPKKQRKVYYAFYDSDFTNPYPVIRLGGKFLEQYGFEVGDRVEVVYGPSIITITKLEVAEDGKEAIHGNRSESESREVNPDTR